MGLSPIRSQQFVQSLASLVQADITTATRFMDWDTLRNKVDKLELGEQNFCYMLEVFGMLSGQDLYGACREGCPKPEIFSCTP